MAAPSDAIVRCPSLPLLGPATLAACGSLTSFSYAKRLDSFFSAACSGVCSSSSTGGGAAGACEKTASSTAAAFFTSPSFFAPALLAVRRPPTSTLDLPAGGAATFLAAAATLPAAPSLAAPSGAGASDERGGSPNGRAAAAPSVGKPAGLSWPLLSSILSGSLEEGDAAAAVGLFTLPWLARNAAASRCRVWRYRAAVDEEYLPSILSDPISDQPCCLKKLRARPLPPTDMVASCESVQVSRVVERTKEMCTPRERWMPAHARQM